MADVLLLPTNDGGEVTIEGGLVEMTDGLETGALLSLTGGNQNDSGRTEDDARQWWGNRGEPVERHQRSAFQNAVRSLPITSGNRRSFEEAAQIDLAWMVPAYCTAVTVVCTIPAVDRLKTEIEFFVIGETEPRRLVHWEHP